MPPGAQRRRLTIAHRSSLIAHRSSLIAHRSIAQSLSVSLAAALLATPHFAHATVAIDPELGIAKGIESGLTFDVKGRTLYDQSGNVLRKDVGFADLLVQCEPQGTAGQVCFDPISAEFGWLDASGAFAGEAWWVEAKQAWYDPTEGAWLDETLAHRELPRVAAAVDARLPRWRPWRGGASALLTAVLALWDEGTTPSLSVPWLDLEAVIPNSPALVAQGLGALPVGKPIPADTLYYRLEKHCGAQADTPLTTGSGHARLSELRVMVAAELGAQRALVQRLNTSAVQQQKATGQKLSALPDPTVQLEARINQFLDGLETWFLLVQGEAPDLGAIGILNFRMTPSGRRMDWWPVPLSTLQGAQEGFRLRARSGPDWFDPARLAEMVMDAECAAGAP